MADALRTICRIKVKSEEGQPMDDKIAQLILDELFLSLEAVETQSAAVLQFLKEKGGARDEELAIYLEQAARASSVKRRAARARIDHLISGIANPPKKAVEQDAAKQDGQAAEAPSKEPEQEKEAREKDADKKPQKDERLDQQQDEANKSQGRKEESRTNADKDSKEEQRSGESRKSALSKDKEPKREEKPESADEAKNQPQEGQGGKAGSDMHKADAEKRSSDKRKPTTKSTAK
jgi:hypothetical protein